MRGVQRHRIRGLPRYNRQLRGLDHLRILWRVGAKAADRSNRPVRVSLSRRQPKRPTGYPGAAGSAAGYPLLRPPTGGQKSFARRGVILTGVSSQFQERRETTVRPPAVVWQGLPASPPYPISLDTDAKPPMMGHRPANLTYPRNRGARKNQKRAGRSCKNERRRSYPVAHRNGASCNAGGLAEVIPRKHERRRKP